MGKFVKRGVWVVGVGIEIITGWDLVEMWFW